MYIVKRPAFIPVAVIATLGVIFIGLDIIDVVEVYNLPLPVNILNALFISAVAMPVAYITARYSAASASPQAFWLGCGVLVFGIGSLFYGWLPHSELNTRITAHEGAAVVAALLHITGAVIETIKPRPYASAVWRKPVAVFAYYLVILASISGVVLLAYRSTIPAFYVPEKGTILRQVVRLVTLVLFFASSLLYLKRYLKSQTIFAYWYSLGLMLFTLGLFLISLSAVEGLIAWLGRAAQYIGEIYFLVAVLVGVHGVGSRNLGIST